MPTPAPLSPSERAALKSRARTITAKLRVGKKGLGEGLHARIAHILKTEPLIKLRFERSAKPLMASLSEEIAAHHSCQVVQILGRVLTLNKPQQKTAPAAAESGA